MAISTEIRIGQYKDDDHREDAPNFIKLRIGQNQKSKTFPSRNYSNSHANWLIGQLKRTLQSKEIIGQSFYPICQSQKETFTNQPIFILLAKLVTSGLSTQSVQLIDDF